MEPSSQKCLRALTIFTRGNRSVYKEPLTSLRYHIIFVSSQQNGHLLYVSITNPCYSLISPVAFQLKDRKRQDDSNYQCEQPAFYCIWECYTVSNQYWLHNIFYCLCQQTWNDEITVVVRNEFLLCLIKTKKKNFTGSKYTWSTMLTVQTVPLSSRLMGCQKNVYLS